MSKKLKARIKSTKTRNPNQPLSHFLCLFCMQAISHDKRYTDRKGKPIPLDQTGKNHHDCLCLDYERNGLKKAGLASHNHDNSTIGECQPRQTTLVEFMDGQGASNERIMDRGGGCMLR